MSFLGKLFRSNLRLKFVLPISAMIAIGLLVMSSYLISRQSAGFLQELEASGQTMIRMLAINAESGVLFENKYELDELLKTPAQFEAVKFVVISNHEGTVLSQLNDSIYNAAGFTLTPAPANIDSAIVQNLTGADGSEYLVLRMPVVYYKQTFNRENLGMTGGTGGADDASAVREVIGQIELGLSLEKVNKAIFEAKVVSYFFTLVVLVGAIVLLAFIVGAITKPVRVMVDVTDQISKGDLTQRVNIRQRDELGHLAETFNRMIESLKQSRDEVEQYNRNLEEKIVERTLQLEEAQAQLIQSEKMSAIGQLAAGVAHELNNPLGGILGYAQFTLEKLNKNIPEKTTVREIQSYIRYVSDIETQARRCKTIVQNLLKFSRSSRTVEFDEVDVNKAIEETLTFVAHQLHLSQIEIEVQLDAKLPHILGNVGQLQQVFTNLIINAMHASAQGSKIRIQSRYSPALGEFAGAVELTFRDFGIGIKDENLKKIFEPFFTTKEIGKGTGLGLSVSYGIVKEHGGEISVQSEVGVGTTFTIVLPVQKPETDTDNRKETNYSFGQ